MTGELVALALAGITGAAVAAGVTVGSRALAAWNERRLGAKREEWERAASLLGLAAAPPTHGAIAELRGQRHAFDVSIALLPFETSGGDDMVRVRVAGRGRWPATVTVGPRGQVMMRGNSGVLSMPQVELRIASFDAYVDAFGPEHDVLAVLDAHAREQLVATAQRMSAWDWTQVGGWSVENGVVECCRGMPDRSADQLLRHVDALVALARALDRGGRPIVQCLADNARNDVAPLRVRHLAALIARFPGNAIMFLACRHALADEDPATRLMAAKALGQEGGATLAAMARDEGAEARFRLPALAAWEGLAPTQAEARPLLESLLGARGAQVRLVAIRAAGRLRCAAVLPSLVALTGYAVDDHARELAIALRLIGDPSAEEAIAHLLGAGGEDVQAEVIHALGVIGTIASVEPLLPLATGLMVSRAVKVRAREALRAIRSRLGPADAGRLSLVDFDDAAGELSIADDASGRVSLDGDATRRDERQQ